MSPALILFLLFIFVPLAEIGVFIQVGGAIGLWPTLALCLLTAIVGTLCIRFQGFRLVNQARAQLEAGEAPVFEVVSGACLVVAGLMLLTPGFVTDAVGFMLLLPPVRRLIFDRFVAGRVATVGRGQTGGRGQAAGRPDRSRPDVLEGEFEEIDEVKGAMPPPRGGWDKLS